MPRFSPHCCISALRSLSSADSELDCTGLIIPRSRNTWYTRNKLLLSSTPTLPITPAKLNSSCTYSIINRFSTIHSCSHASQLSKIPIPPRTQNMIVVGRQFTANNNYNTRIHPWADPGLAHFDRWNSKVVYPWVDTFWTTSRFPRMNTLEWNICWFITFAGLCCEVCTMSRTTLLWFSFFFKNLRDLEDWTVLSKVQSRLVLRIEPLEYGQDPICTIFCICVESWTQQIDRLNRG